MTRPGHRADGAGISARYSALVTERKVILIADDDASEIFFLRQAIVEQCARAEIKQARDGQEVIDYLKRAGRAQDPELYPMPTHLLLDIRMPLVSGLEVLRWMRQDPLFQAMPVTVFSGSHLESDMESARSLGARYLVKPVDYLALSELVRRNCAQFGV